MKQAPAALPPPGGSQMACQMMNCMLLLISEPMQPAQVLALVGLFVHCRRERNAKFPPEVEQV